MNHPGDDVGHGLHPSPPWSEETLVSFAMQSSPDSWLCVIESHRDPEGRTFLTTRFITQHAARGTSVRLTIGRDRFDSSHPPSLFNPPQEIFWIITQPFLSTAPATHLDFPTIVEGLFKLLCERIRNSLIREILYTPLRLDWMEPDGFGDEAIGKISFDEILHAVESDPAIDWNYTLTEIAGTPPSCEARFTARVLEWELELSDSFPNNPRSVPNPSNSARLIVRSTSGQSLAHGLSQNEIHRLLLAAQKRMQGTSRP